MKRILLFLTFSITVICLKAQDVVPVQDSIKKEENREDEREIFMVIEKMPEFPGGYLALKKYLSENVIYPPKAIENNIQGRVVVSFIVEKDGSISNIKVVKSVSLELDEEAVRIVSNMPLWSPGTQRGVPVRIRMNVPVTFKPQ